MWRASRSCWDRFIINACTHGRARGKMDLFQSFVFSTLVEKITTLDLRFVLYIKNLSEQEREARYICWSKGGVLSSLLFFFSFSSPSLLYSSLLLFLLSLSISLSLSLYLSLFLLFSSFFLLFSFFFDISDSIFLACMSDPLYLKYELWVLEMYLFHFRETTLIHTDTDGQITPAWASSLTSPGTLLLDIHFTPSFSPTQY